MRGKTALWRLTRGFEDANRPDYLLAENGADEELCYPGLNIGNIVLYF